MKYLIKSEKIEIPKGVTVTAKSRVITVKGPKGTVTKNFRHIKAEIDIQKDEIQNLSALSYLKNSQDMPKKTHYTSHTAPYSFLFARQTV